MSKGKIAGIVIAVIMITVVGLVVWTIAKNDPFIETMEGACYPDMVDTWRKEPGPRLFVTCVSHDGKIRREVEVKRKGM